ncbi:SDR family NAD(P)-dependent oxidoreductase [Amycolatopsis taiwanensis]|uniref:Short chain dehydrogenase n=1 Tax=Amycolatopsis taiwanensis TaxID=342230 RepID=A0A9W6QZQ2_9PSEU|nr:glucose 1-dehydrogenase [Amycolatopsis taiwanensis]GLY65608.1 short chain dehydrogenase [Amycolatopsis taiwanensis]
MRFEGRFAVVTGAAAGFGLAVSARLTAEGARVVMVDRAAEALKQAAASVPGAVPVVADVSHESEVDAYVARATAEFGRIDLFFNNAGIEGRMAPMTELSVDDFDRVWAVNGRGVFLGLRAVLKVMKAQKSGAIVNTASMAAIRGSATFSPYVAAKHAVAGLTRCAALEGAPFGIRVNGIAPGHIDTRMARDLTAQIDPDDPDSVFDRVSKSIPLGRYGTAEEVANLAVWLLSDEASYVSGATHLIDGALNA